MVRLNEREEIVREEWLRSEEIRHEIELDKFIIMPNHIHGVVVIYTETSIVGGTVIVGAIGRSPLQSQPLPGPAKHSLGSHVAGFKSAVTRHINQWRGTPYKPIWQRNYYEHVIRNEYELNRIREYIINNPLQWQFDRENPRCIQDKAYDTQWGHLEGIIYGRDRV